MRLIHGLERGQPAGRSSPQAEPRNRRLPAVGAPGPCPARAGVPPDVRAAQRLRPSSAVYGASDDHARARSRGFGRGWVPWRSSCGPPSGPVDGQASMHTGDHSALSWTLARRKLRLCWVWHRLCGGLTVAPSVVGHLGLSRGSQRRLPTYMRVRPKPPPPSSRGPGREIPTGHRPRRDANPGRRHSKLLARRVLG